MEIICFRFNNIDAVKFLLENNANVKIQCDIDTIPLHSAARRGHLEIAKLLVEKDKTTINTQGQGYVTPLFLACKGGDSDMCQWLIDNGADITLVANGNKTCLHHASWFGHFDVVKVIVETGMKIYNRVEANEAFWNSEKSIGNPNHRYLKGPWFHMKIIYHLSIVSIHVSNNPWESLIIKGMGLTRTVFFSKPRSNLLASRTTLT